MDNQFSSVRMDHESVQQVVTFAMPHKSLGEEVAAAVVLRDGSSADEKSIREFAAERLARVPAELRLVATHDWDTHGAMCAGLLAAYIDRSGAPYHALYRRPDVYGTDMGDVVAQILAADSKR